MFKPYFVLSEPYRNSQVHENGERGFVRRQLFGDVTLKDAVVLVMRFLTLELVDSHTNADEMEEDKQSEHMLILHY